MISFRIEILKNSYSFFIKRSLRKEILMMVYFTLSRYYLIFFLASLLSVASVLSQVPRTISFEGVLTNASGDSGLTGDPTITFNLYETSTGGAAV